MELIQLPRPMRARGFTGWPEVYRIGKDEPVPPPGISYLIADEVDFALVFRIMVPILMKQHPYLDWSTVYKSIAGEPYYEQRVYRTIDEDEDGSGEGHAYTVGGSRCEVSLEELSSDKATYVDLDMLTELAMIPAFMTDIRDAITTNVTNSFQWTDGYNKKLGTCSGYLVEQPAPRSLVILDISGSIPDGISSGMLTLIKTITDVVNSDLIITGSTSKFYTRDEARQLDIREVRNKCGKGNEGVMFWDILNSHDMNYDNVITFGDSDHPMQFDSPRKDQDEKGFSKKVTVGRWYSFFCMRRDQYGRNADLGCGYGRWVNDCCPTVTRIDNTDWAKFFKKDGSGQW